MKDDSRMQIFRQTDYFIGVYLSDYPFGGSARKIENFILGFRYIHILYCVVVCVAVCIDHNITVLAVVSDYARIGQIEMD